jgi:hypothetical protein
MESLGKNFVFSVLLLLILYASGVVIYHNLEGWDWLTSLYFMTATFTTVGYGDVAPLTDEGRLFTVFFIWTGVSIGFYFLFLLSRYRESKFDRTVLRLLRKAGARRMLPELEELGHVGSEQKKSKHPLEKGET